MNGISFPVGRVVRSRRSVLKEIDRYRAAGQYLRVTERSDHVRDHLALHERALEAGIADVAEQLLHVLRGAAAGLVGLGRARFFQGIPAHDASLQTVLRPL